MLVKPKRTNFISANQPWWDEECSHAKHLKYSAKCRFRVTGHKEDYCKYINLRKTFKSLCRCKKIAYQNDERNKLVSARNNPKTFPSILKQNIGTVNEISDINSADWMDYFKNLLCKSNQPSLSDFVCEVNEEDDGSFILNSPIHIDEIYRSIYRLKPGKAQGTDGIVAEFYKKH